FHDTVAFAIYASALLLLERIRIDHVLEADHDDRSGGAREAAERHRSPRIARRLRQAHDGKVFRELAGRLGVGLPLRPDVRNRNALADLAERVGTVVDAARRLAGIGLERMRDRDRKIEGADEKRGRRTSLTVGRAYDHADAAEGRELLIG